LLKLVSNDTVYCSGAFKPKVTIIDISSVTLLIIIPSYTVQSYVPGSKGTPSIVKNSIL